MKYFYGDKFSVDSYDTLLYITIDPAGGTSPENATRRTDKWGIAVVAVTAEGKWFVLDLEALHLTEEMFIEKLWELDARWHPYRIGIEKSPHLNAYIRMAMTKKGRSLNLTELTPKGRKKERRIQALSAKLPDTYFNSKILGDTQQMMRRWYTEQEHGDDSLDALAYMVDIAVPPTPQMLQEQQSLRDYAEERDALSRLPVDQRPEWEAWLKKEKEMKHGKLYNEEVMEMYDY